MMKLIYHITITWIALLCLTATHEANAFDDMPVRHAASLSGQCVQEFTRAERKYGIPKHLLMAISNTESGRYHKQMKRVIPWPWTLNIDGKGYYFDTMHDAITAVNRAKARGADNIDVGCMQISLKHHPKAFTGIKDALTPERNIQYAASFLRSNFDELGSWSKAIAAYHSRTPKYGNKYYAMVRKRWRDVRGIAGGDAIEASEYMMAGVKVTKIPVSSAVAQPAAGTAPPENSTFKLAMRDANSGETVEMDGAGKQAPFKAVAVKTATPQKLMKVIKVDLQENDDSRVNIKPTPMALRANKNLAFADNSKTYSVKNNSKAGGITSASLKEAGKSLRPLTKSPNFIFGSN